MDRAAARTGKQEWALKMGLADAGSIEDRSIPTFARGKLPPYAGINSFLKARYITEVRDVGKYDAAHRTSAATCCWARCWR